MTERKVLKKNGKNCEKQNCETVWKKLEKNVEAKFWKKNWKNGIKFEKEF